MIFISSLCFGQGDYRQGYIIKSNGDSISGYVGYRGKKSNYKSCLFKESKKGEKIRYSPSELKAYGIIDDRRFESKRVEIDSGRAEMRFIEIIIKGAVSLYSYKNIYFIEKDSLVKLPKSKSVTVQTAQGPYKKEDKRFVGILNYMLSDCNVMGPDVKYQERYLTGIIYHYNQCKGHSGIDFKGKKPWAKVNFQIFASESISKLYVDGYNKNTFNTSYSPTGGIGLDFSLPRSSDKIFFSIEGWYVKNMFQGYVETIEPSRTIRTDLFLKAPSYKFSMGIKYNFLHPNLTPYLKGGFVQYVPLDPTWSSVKESEDVNGVVYTESSSRMLQKKLPMGFWLGVGYSKQIINGLNGFIELRIDKNNGYTGSDVQASSSSTNINLIIGLRY
ncbi:MAG: hypothetical protein ABI663_07920 [Chryseolinea sp.]